MIFNQLEEFRQQIYSQLGKARDALFDLMDAVLVSSSIRSYVSLSLSPVFRRQWPSIYAALQDSRLSPNKVMNQVIGQVITSTQPILVGDSSSWERPDAVTLRERGYEHSNGNQIFASIFSRGGNTGQTADNPGKIPGAFHYLDQPGYREY